LGPLIVNRGLGGRPPAGGARRLPASSAGLITLPPLDRYRPALLWESGDLFLDKGRIVGELLRCCGGLFGAFTWGPGADLIACGGNAAGIGFSTPASASEVEAPLDAAAPEGSSKAAAGRVEPASTYLGRGADALAGGLGTGMVIVVLGVFSPPLNSLTPSSESMSASLSKAGPFLNPGVVRFPMKDVTSYWVPPELTFIRDMLPDMLPVSPLFRLGESGNDCGVVG